MQNYGTTYLVAAGQQGWQAGSADIPRCRPTQAGFEAEGGRGQSVGELPPSTSSRHDIVPYSVYPNSAVYGSGDPDLRHECEAMMPSAATALDQRLDFTSRLSTPISMRPSYRSLRTLSADLEQEYAPSYAGESYYGFDPPDFATPDLYFGPASEQAWYSREPLSGTAERYASSGEYGYEASGRGCDPSGWPPGSMALANGGQYRCPANVNDYRALEYPARSYAPQWDSVDSAVNPFRAPSQLSNLPPPTAGGPATYYATPPSSASTRTHNTMFLPPLPAAPPLSAASYSLSPSGPTLSSFAAMTIGVPAGNAQQTPAYPYLGYDSELPNPLLGASARGTGETAPAWLSQFVLSPFASREDRFDGGATAGRVDETDSPRIKLEPESSPELPPSPTGPHFQHAARPPPATTRAPPAERPRPIPARVDDALWLSVDNAAVPEDWNGASPSPSSSDGGGDSSPEWTPLASSPRGRPAQRKKTGPPSRSDARSSPPASRPSRRRHSSSNPRPSRAFPPPSPPGPRISPITGQPVKPIAKRVFPPRDAHKRKFVCDFEGCGKTFGRPSARNTHMRSHSGQKPFTCPIPHCARSFSVFSNLKRHMVVHPTVDFHHVTVHDLPLMRWVPCAKGATPTGGGSSAMEQSEGGRLEWIEEIEQKKEVKVEEADEGDGVLRQGEGADGT
ncbi:hypothetical protein JCM3774_003638 [Rhodotorula dairenensis]